MTITVGWLCAKLAKLRPDMRVAFMIDSESNGYRWVTRIATDGLVCEAHDWCPKIVLERWMAGMNEEQRTNVTEHATEKVVVLLPDNLSAVTAAPAVTVGDMRTALAALPSDLCVALMTRRDGSMTWATDLDTEALVVEDDGWAPALAVVERTAEDMMMDTEEWDAMKATAERVMFLGPAN